LMSDLNCGDPKKQNKTKMSAVRGSARKQLERYSYSKLWSRRAKDIHIRPNDLHRYAQHTHFEPRPAHQTKNQKAKK